MSGYRKLSPITMTPGEYSKAKEEGRTYADAKRRDREWDRMAARYAAQGIRMHPLEDSPYSEERFSPCTPGCKHWSGAA